MTSLVIPWNKVDPSVAIHNGETSEVLASRVREDNKTSRTVYEIKNRTKDEKKTKTKKQKIMHICLWL